MSRKTEVFSHPETKQIILQLQVIYTVLNTEAMAREETPMCTITTGV